MKPLFLLMLAGCSLFAIAQPNPGTIMQEQLIKDWQRAKTYTLQYLEAMPANQYQFRPVDSVRNFAEQMLHLAQSNAGMSVIGTGYKTPDFVIFAQPNFGKSHTMHNKDSVYYYVTKSYDIMIDAIRQLDINTMNEEVTFRLGGGDRTTTRLGWIQKAFEHQTHHRGQCTVYFRLVGIRPPAELLWDE